MEGTSSDDQGICSICKAKFADKNDPKKTEDWIMCIVCEDWFHETCGEENGIIEDGEAFTCAGCLDA